METLKEMQFTIEKDSVLVDAYEKIETSVKVLVCVPFLYLLLDLPVPSHGVSYTGYPAVLPLASFCLSPFLPSNLLSQLLFSLTYLSYSPFSTVCLHSVLQLHGTHIAGE